MVFCTIPIAIWILISGLDDLFITIATLIPRRVTIPEPLVLARTQERPIAIFVPLWREHQVISRMLNYNFATIQYRNYHVFAGVYPNDAETSQAVAEHAQSQQRVHIAVNPHNGPTSKADNLNAIYARMEEYERRHDIRFRIVVTHDAEDLVDPDSLRLINYFSRRHAMVQMPVLPLPTGVREFPHGLYCDEFAEYQQKDIPVRCALGGFLPSNGVGTGFDREALEHLAATRSGRPFDPACLTEDYETGYRLHALGYSQVFVPVRFAARGPVATREIFPRTWRGSVSQRTRWVTGIALQGWQHHGWPFQQVYWFWRDRKAIAGNLLSPLANVLFAYGAVRLAMGGGFAELIPQWLLRACEITCGITLVQTAVRVHSTALIYGYTFAALAPARMLYGNLVNFSATVLALRDYFGARRRGQVPAWRKTEHLYYPAAAPVWNGHEPRRKASR